MRTRREALLALGAFFVAPSLSSAQGRKRPWRIGFLSARSRPLDLESDYHGGFPRGLRELGYALGKDIVIEYRYANGDYGRLPALAAELARLPLDVIVTADGTPSALAARKATRTIPIVFAAAGDPVGNGLVQSLARPGGNATGISLLANDTNLKQMELLHGVVPKLARLGVLWNPTNPFSAPALESLKAAALTTKVQVVATDVRTPEEIEKAFAAFVREHAGAVTWITDGFLIQQRRQIADLAARHRLPSVGGLREYVEAGGLMSYGPNREENYRRAAILVDKILRGAKPADIPVQAVGMELCPALGITIPSDLLVLADKVIE